MGAFPNSYIKPQMEQIKKKKHGEGGRGRTHHSKKEKKTKNKKHKKQLTLNREIEYLLFFRLYG